jgi:ADP-heptose:LPS heptosyltransferase
LLGVHLGGQAADIARHATSDLLIAPPWNLHEVAAVQKSAACTIAPDTALLHLADFLGTPTIGIFGPTSTLRNGPWITTGNATYTLQADCPHHHDRVHGSTDCMADISVAKVFETIQKVLQNTQPLSLPLFFSHTQQENNIVAR